MSTAHDPEHGYHNSRTPPEHALIIAILGRAILDLFGSTGVTINPTEAANVRHEALRFLTDTTGGWAKRRSDLCDVVGIDGDDMRDRVVRVLEGGDISLDVFDARNTIATVEGARELWAYQKLAPEREQAARDERTRKVNARTQFERLELIRRAHQNSHMNKAHITETTIFEILRGGQKTIREILFALDGELETSAIRTRLVNLVEQSLVEHNTPFWRVKRPETVLVEVAC